MTTGNKHWAIGRAVERAFAAKDAVFHVYQRGNADDWMVRDATANHPKPFLRRYKVYAFDQDVVVQST